MKDTPIVQVTLQRGAHSLVRYKVPGSRAIRRRIQVLRMEDLWERDVWPHGVYAFTSLDGMTPAQLNAARWLWKRLASQPVAFAPLNDPDKVIGRYHLLKRLYEAGINDFMVHRVAGLPCDVRLPAFVRYENLHRGNLTGLLNTRMELDDAIARLLLQGERAEDLIVTEFLDTSDDRGVYRKYGAHVLGKAIFPKHLMAGRHWMIKMKTSDRGIVGEDEVTYVTEAPHRDLLEPIFAISGHTWGRVDYSFYKGRIQVWEVNDNPEIGTKRKRDRGRARVHRIAFPRWLAALDEASKGISDPGPSCFRVSARDVLKL